MADLVFELLSPAEQAVLHILRRMREDADLRHHMVLTESFRLLCVAEAERLSEFGPVDPAALEEKYSTPAAAYRDEESKLSKCRKVMRDFVLILTEQGIHREDWGRDLIVRIERAL